MWGLVGPTKKICDVPELGQEQLASDKALDQVSLWLQALWLSLNEAINVQMTPLLTLCNKNTPEPSPAPSALARGKMEVHDHHLMCC